MATALGDVQARLLGPVQGRHPDRRPPALFELNPGRDYGAAVDIGTTTVAAYLYRLSDGKLLKTLAEKNPQSVYGGRALPPAKSIEGERNGLADSIRGCISRIMGEFCAFAGIPAEKLDSLVLTGNTAMLYLLCGRDPQSIAVAPFEQDCDFGFFLDGQKLDLPGNIRVYLPKCISAYVGADITTALLASEFFQQGKVASDRPRLLVDIGTNGEMALAADGALLCCSTAAGPLRGRGHSSGNARSHRRHIPNKP